jgi:hypothetical protein
MTNVALSAMLGATPPAGYESLYFDRTARELRGGIRKYIGRRTPDKVPSSYMDDLDYQEPLPFEFLIYVLRRKYGAPTCNVSASDSKQHHKRATILHSSKLLTVCFTAQGPERLAVALESLDKILSEIRAFCGNETEIVMFSDHGMNLEENRRVGPCLYSAAERFSACDSGVWSLQLCGDLLSRRSAIPEMRDASVEVTGIDFAVYKDARTSLSKATRAGAH